LGDADGEGELVAALGQRSYGVDAFEVLAQNDAEQGEMLAEVAVFDEEVAPDAAAEDLPADELAWMFEQSEEQVDGSRRQRDDFSAPVQDALFGIKMKGADGDARHGQTLSRR
jgi:hypothetical protein